MLTYRQMVSQVGRPVVRIPTRYRVLRATLTPCGWIGHVQRRRQLGTIVVFTWMVVRSPAPLIEDGRVLRRLPAIVFRGSHFETRRSKSGRTTTTATLADPKTWFSDYGRALAAFHRVVGRGGR